MPLSRIFIFLCIAFIAGVVINSLIFVPQTFVYSAFILAIILISIFWKKHRKIVVAGACLFLMAIGVYRHQMFDRPADNLDYYKKSQTEALARYSNEDGLNALGMLGGFKDKLSESLDASLSPPQSSILGAMMLGEKDRLSSDLKEKLNRSGTRHITAISGMHIMILAQILIGLGLVLGLWRGQAFYFALIMIILFIIMVGAPPSAIRAGIMGGTVLFAQKIGRLSQAQRLLIIAAAIMLALNPLLIKFDVGFQLSFLATLGIAKLSPWFFEKFRWAPRVLGLRNIAAMTFPAVIFTAPMLASNFGQISIISIFTNILIVPILGFILGIGFFAGILGIIFQPLGQILFWPAWLFLGYIYKIIDWSSQLPFAAIQIETFPWYLVFMYFALLWWAIKYFRMER